MSFKLTIVWDGFLNGFSPDFGVCVNINKCSLQISVTKSLRNKSKVNTILVHAHGVGMEKQVWMHIFGNFWHVSFVASL